MEAQQQQKPQPYDPLVEEEKLQAYWEKEKIYAFNPDSDKEIYSIDTPPPTVSGAMHIGHAFSYSQQDFVVRFQRMLGKNVFYPFGTDDNGLPTEKLVEKTKNVTSKKMDRNTFVKLCLETLDSVRPGFIADWKRIGISCDFSLTYSTINEHSQRISQQSFIDLYKAGRIYQKKAPLIFCPHCKTAIAQVEMQDEEKSTTLNYVKAKVETGEYIIYATTRPELHPSCVGISLNKEGEYVTAQVNEEQWIISKDAVVKLEKEFPLKIIATYKGSALVGKRVHIPFAQEPIAITHDISAKTEYGTGVVYYCTYGGLDCVEWMTRHIDVKPVLIMDESGVYNTLSPYHGMTSEQARKQILTDLEQQGALIKKQTMKHAVNVHERCGFDIEYIATKQWFIRYLDLREHFLDVGNQLQWYPSHMKSRYDNWIKGLQWDWCISRQRHFGIPIPLWYDKQTGEVILADTKQLPVDPLKDVPKGYNIDQVIPEKDVLDTWATSSMTPQLAIGLLGDHPITKKLFPMDLRPQAHDIITFWLFNTLVKSQLHHNVNPWKHVMISGWALDPHGKKMSKSKGNVVHPQEVVSKYGADALRFWAAGSKLGEDLPYQEKDLLTGKKMINKLWNASRFVCMHLEHYKKPIQAPPLQLFDRWLLSKLQRLVIDATDTFKEYEYARVKKDTEYFFWHNLCDNYLELCKDRLYNVAVRGEQGKHAAQYALYITLLTCLKLFAPIMPYVTDSVYLSFYAHREKKKSVHVSTWPEVSLHLIDEEAEAAGDALLAIVTHIRKLKSTKNVSIKVEVAEVILDVEASIKEKIQEGLADVQATLNIKKLHFGTATEEIHPKVKIAVVL